MKKNREPKQRRRQRQRKRHLKIYLYFICATLRLFQLAQLLQKWRTIQEPNDRSGVQFQKENEKFTVVRSRAPQNPKCGHFTLLFCRGRQRNVPKCKTHLQSDCFCSLNLSVFFAALSLPLPSSLLKLPNVFDDRRTVYPLDGNLILNKVTRDLVHSVRSLHWQDHCLLTLAVTLDSLR